MARRKSQLRKRISQLVRQGKSRKQATAIAWRESGTSDLKSGLAYFPKYWASEKLAAPPNPDMEERFSDYIGPFTVEELSIDGVDMLRSRTDLIIEETGDPNWAAYGSMDRIGQDGKILKGFRRGRWMKVEIPQLAGRPIGSKYRKPPLSAVEAQRRRKERGGPIVNAFLEEPVPRFNTLRYYDGRTNSFVERDPDDQCNTVDDIQCIVCGEFYQEVNLGISNSKAIEFIRENNIEGGYRSRGPLLWSKRVLKMRAFYDRHAACCDLAFRYHSRFVTVPPSMVWIQQFYKNPAGAYRTDPRIRNLLKSTTPEFKAANVLYKSLDMSAKGRGNSGIDIPDPALRDPANYTKTQQKQLQRIRKLLDRRQEKNRQKLGLPSRQEAGRIWDDNYSSKLAVAMASNIYPFDLSGPLEDQEQLELPFS